jgi:putative hemolysin
MAFLATIGAPLVWLLDTSSAVIIRLFGIQLKGAFVTAEELHMIFADATQSGVTNTHQILTGVVRLAEARARDETLRIVCFD